MDKKFKISDKLTVTKIVYVAVIAILCISAIVVGIIAAASKKDEVPEEVKPPVSNEDDNKAEEPPKEEKTVFIAPVVGDVVKFHSMDTPVFSDTLGEWRIHTGVDICTPEGADVFASCGGTVSAVYDHPRFGRTVEITHTGGIVTCYSNLSKDGQAITVGQEIASGEKIGTVGDTAISELAEEAHLHFEIKVNNAPVNPLDYLSEESKNTSLGINKA